MTVPATQKQAATTSPSDAPLLVEIARGDLGSLGILYDRHARAVWRVIHRVTNGADDVDDIVHATFLKVMQIAKTFDGRPSARSWVTGIAVRLALRRSRSAHRLARALTRFIYVSARVNAVDPEVLVGERERLTILEKALAKLSPAKRAVFVLVEIEGLTHEEVCNALEIPLATVRTRLFHAKRSLRSALAAAEAR